jgi:hypothetical protein
MHLRSSLALVGAFALAACSGAAAPSPTPVGAASPAPAAAEAGSPIAAAAVVPYRCEGRDVTWDGTSAIDLTGTWAGDDAGVYYLRQIGDQVWWLGTSGLGGPFANRGDDFTNVYRGTLSGDTLTGTYADVPQGKILDSGPVDMKLTPTSGGGIALVRTDPVLETGFGGKRFTPCSLR